MALTDTWLKAQLGREHPGTFTRADRDGLAARVSPKGKVTFQIRYRLNGKRERMDVGSYPLTTLKQARHQAMQVRQQLDQGHDPRVQREIERQRREGAITVERMFRDWYDSYCLKHKANPRNILRSVEIHCFPEIGDLPADQVSTDRWMTLLEHVAEDSPSIAERLLINIKQAYKWAHRRGRVNAHPLQHITARADLHLKKRTSTRVLDEWEIALVWEAAQKSRMMPKNRLFVLLCMLYGCRSSELRLSNIEDWDFEQGVWHIPVENHKTGKSTGKPLKRPIIDPAREWVEEAIRLAGRSTGPLFTNRDSDERMGRSAVLPLPYNVMQWARRHRGKEMGHWSMHDLRRTMRTRISDIVPPHVAEIMLGHVMPGQWGVYDRYDYLAEQREAYEAWWERLRGIVTADHAASSDS